MPVLIRDVPHRESMQDIPFKEIAEIQQAPLGTILSRMHRASKYLKQALQTEDQSENQTESIRPLDEKKMNVKPLFTPDNGKEF